jgi:hypothetical protein
MARTCWCKIIPVKRVFHQSYKDQENTSEPYQNYCPKYRTVMSNKENR